MAAKKSGNRAEKLVTDTKKKTSAGGSNSKNSAKKTSSKKAPAASKKSPKVKTEYENAIPNYFVVAFVSVSLFILFLVTSSTPLRNDS